MSKDYAMPESRNPEGKKVLVVKHNTEAERARGLEVGLVAEQKA